MPGRSCLGDLAWAHGPGPMGPGRTATSSTFGPEPDICKAPHKGIEVRDLYKDFYIDFLYNYVLGDFRYVSMFVSLILKVCVLIWVQSELK